MFDVAFVPCRFAACCAAAALLLGVGTSADARSWSVQGPRGGTWTRTVTPFNNGGDNLGRTVTTTRPNGESATHVFTRGVSGGTITNSRTATGFNGAARSESLTRTPGQRWTASYTGRGGNTYSDTSSRYNNGNGNLGRTTTVSGPAGTTTRQFSQTNNGSGTYTDSRAVTLPDGEAYTRSHTREAW